MGTFRDPSTINNVGPKGGATNPETGQSLPMERENQKAIREMVGAFGYEALTISAGGITPTKAEVTVDTEAGASADDLTTIYLVSDGTTTLHDGMILTVRAYDPARVVTVKHNTGVNQIQTLSGSDVVLGTDWGLSLKLQSGVWKEIQGKPVINITGNAATATIASTCSGNSATATQADTLKQGGLAAPTSAGTSTAYTVTSSPVVSALVAGNVYQFKAHTACGSSPTVNFDGLGAKALKAFSGGSKVALAANDLPSGYPVAVMYDGTDMVVLNMPGTALKSYDSGELTITLSGDSVLTHGLGAQPKIITMILRCKTAEGAYSVNDEVYYTTSGAEDQATGFSVVADATNIRARAGTAAPCVIRKDGSGRIFITTGNWKLIVRAYA